MGHDVTTDKVRNIMIEFADRTGLTSARHPPRRYLWTDAHAVCNFLSLYRRTNDAEYKRLAQCLIEQVHTVLGKHREDDSRSGWISGLSDREGKIHPTAGGLRIGKKLNERRPGDIFDDRLEWDRDGQYFHYLTKWMHALCRASAATGDRMYCGWAVELAKVAQARFATSTPKGEHKQLRWKMSIDLSYPLVASAGLHDPLDAFVTYSELVQCTNRLSGDGSLANLDAEIAETSAMLGRQDWHTDDPLGVGGLLFDAGRAFQLSAEKRLRKPYIAEELLQTARESLDALLAQSAFRQAAQFRLAFRELGLSIGLRAVAGMRQITTSNPDLFGTTVNDVLEHLRRLVPLGAAIEEFWSAADNQKAGTWLDHLDINTVMLATSLLPDEFLKI